MSRPSASSINTKLNLEEVDFRQNISKTKYKQEDEETEYSLVQSQMHVDSQLNVISKEFELDKQYLQRLFSSDKNKEKRE